jgi:hypothetical protein
VKYIIQLLIDGYHGADMYVWDHRGGFSNITYCPFNTTNPDHALKFDTLEAAQAWCRAYLPGYKHRIVWANP